ncbi:MAG: heme exporter protein CcmB [Bacteroidales bacterium]|jgi:heme exporter protein B|nr:heme exporter protein CcmB [Bacteroidales bacterium]
MLQEVKQMIRKEITLEWRQKFAFNGVLLYLVSTVFVCYLSFDRLIDVPTWNALFWIILMFASINAVLKSFLQERDGRLLYYYTLVKPQSIINAKIVYNALLMSALGIAGLVVFIGFMGNPVKNIGLFLVNMLLGVTGFSAVLSMVSAIASKARNNFTLMAVLSFPLILPLLLVLIRVSSDAIHGATVVEALPKLLVILLLSVITLVLSNVLFPYIWKE